MKRLLFLLMMFECLQISFNTSTVSALVPIVFPQKNDSILLEEFIAKRVYWCGSKIDNVLYIITSNELPIKVSTYLKGRSINMKLENKSGKEVTYHLKCNGFVHPVNESFGKEKVDSEYTYTKTLANNESVMYTIGHRGLIPIIGHGGVPGDYMYKGRAYLDMLYAGFDVSICNTELDSVINMLNAAEGKGLKLVIGGGFKDPVWYSDLVKNTKKNKSTIYGYYIGDEPFLKYNEKYKNHATISDLIPRANAIRNIIPDANIRICLNPIYGPETIKEDDTYDNQKYAEITDSCITKLGLKTLAFDNYSIVWSNGCQKEVLRRQWFDNLKIIRSQSLKHKIPFCGYVLSAQHLSYMMPTLGKIRLQMYANLAYGAKSIAYYTYWHRELESEGIYTAPIDPYGQRRIELYNTLNRVNEEMSRISPLFAEGTVKHVFHVKGGSSKMSEVAPSNELVKELDPNHLPDNIESLRVDGTEGAIVSIISKGDSTFMAVVNKDFKNPITLHISGNEYAYHVSKLNLKNDKKASGDYIIEAGDIIIFNLTQRRSRIPIVAYWGVPEDMASVKVYNDLYDAGFDISLRPIRNEGKAIKSLQYADTAGVQVILGNASYTFNDSSLVTKTKDYKSLYGYFVRDEPVANDLSKVKNRIDNIHKYDNGRFCYVKMKPAFYTNFLTDTSFQTYLDQVSDLDISTLTYRYSPFKQNDSNGVDINWYRYLEMIRKKNKEFWGYIQCTQQPGLVQPTLGKLKLQANVNLAYGAKALEYFAVWNPKYDSIQNLSWSHSPIDSVGNRCPEIYNWVNKLNEEIAKISPLFANGVVEEVYHVGSTIPVGTLNFKDYINPQKLSITTDGKGGIVSFVRKGRDTFMVLVNKDYEKKQIFDISFENGLLSDCNLESLTNNSHQLLSNMHEISPKPLGLIGIPASEIKVFLVNSNLNNLKNNKNVSPKLDAELQSRRRLRINNISEIQAPVTVQIYTISGVNVYSGNIICSSHGNVYYDIDLPESLRRGVCYILRINGANGSYVKKISL